jgi:hypothetical protein
MGHRPAVIRPDQFQIQSLTMEDFLAGKTLPAEAGIKYVLDDDPERIGQRTSKYKFMSRSGITDAAGLRGHNTYGNDSKVDNSNPSIILMDVANGA